MRILIVEDEPNYRDTLEMFIDELGYELCGSCANGKDALALFSSLSPDLVLMDINLEGELSGIDLARIFNGHGPIPLIFITSFDDPETFAEAKKTVPFSYLIKPFNPDVLQRSIELAVQYAHVDGRGEFENNKDVVLAPQSLFVKDRNKLIKTRFDEILWVEVEDKYCIIHTIAKKFTLRLSLKELALKLDTGMFVQTHRSYMVNANAIEGIDLSLFIVKVGNAEIPLGRAYRDHLVSRLKML